MTAQLTLQPESSAARIARHWVRQELTQLSRPELLESAVLGVSELVTNALLHVRGTINVRIVDADNRLRIEVHDDSTRAPDGASPVQVSTLANPPTIGRGLQIVDSISLSWGVAYEDAGKVVWFQPMPEGSHDPGEAPVLPDPARAAEQVRADVESFDVELVDVPLELLVHYRVRFRDLRRELTLIALDSNEHASVGDRLNDVARRLEAFRQVGSNAEKEIDEAIDAGQDRTTVHYRVPLAAVPGIIELRNLLTEADAFCRERRLLTLAAGPQENAMRSWYLGEVIAQAKGEAPTPWPGDFVVTDPEPLH